MAVSRTGRKRPRIPPAWVLFVVALAMFALGGFRYAIDSNRSWESSAIIGALAIVGGLAVAVARRSFR